MTKKKINKKQKYPILNTIRPKEMKAWQDCQWRRVPCLKDSCPICGPIKKSREKNIKAGKDPDSMEAALEFVGETFKETMSMLKKDAERMGIDLDNLDDTEYREPPRPEEYPLYNEAMAWRQGIYEIAEASDDVSSAWMYTEAGEDLLWYANTLLAKIYRQLSNLWHIEDEGEEYMDLEFGYTGYVLNEVLDILEKALKELSRSDSPHARKFNLARLSLTGIRSKLEIL